MNGLNDDWACPSSRVGQYKKELKAILFTGV